MDIVPYLIHDRGTKICQSCFHKRYSKRKHAGYTDNRKYSVKDLKRHLEKDWD